MTIGTAELDIVQQLAACGTADDFFRLPARQYAGHIVAGRGWRRISRQGAISQRFAVLLYSDKVFGRPIAAVVPVENVGRQVFNLILPLVVEDLLSRWQHSTNSPTHPDFEGFDAA